MPYQSGSIVPGASKTFQFLFKPKHGGAHLEHWTLRTSPACTQLPGGSTVTLRGFALQHDEHALARSKLQADLCAREKLRQVAAALERILQSVHVPAATCAPLAPELWAEHDAFAAGTAGLQPPVFFYPGVGPALEAVFNGVRQALVPPADPKKKAKKGEAPVATVPDVFDGRVDSLLALVEQVCGCVSVATQ